MLGVRNFVFGVLAATSMSSVAVAQDYNRPSGYNAERRDDRRDYRRDRRDARRDDRRYAADGRRGYDDCRDDKRGAGQQGTAVGAVGGGAGTALLGGGLGESVAGAAVGALAGNVIGRSTEKCGKGRYRR